MTIGIASAVVGVAVLLAWIPLRNRPGIGTMANVIVIAVTVDAGSLAVLPTPTALPVRVAMMLGAVLLNAFSTVLYIGAGLGPGPRDGLMTGLVARTGLSVRLVRTVDRGDRAGRRLAARRHRRRRHRGLRVRHRPAGAADPADHAAAAAGPQRWASVTDASDFGVPRRAQRDRSRRNRKGDPRGAPPPEYGTMVPCPETMQPTPTC